jgi:hypothetical protein
MRLVGAHWRQISPNMPKFSAQKQKSPRCGLFGQETTSLFLFRFWIWQVSDRPFINLSSQAN